MWSRDRDAIFSVDHVVARSEDPSRIGDYDNLVYACLRCNSAKQAIRTLDPTREPLGLHLRAEPDGSVVGLTADGLFLVRLLHLNATSACEERRRIRRILERYDRSPADPAAVLDYLRTFGFPEDLPDLRGLRPPNGNRLSENEEQCAFARREKNELPLAY
jgi:hypothetical protein